MKKSVYLIIIAILPFVMSCRKFHSIEGNHQVETESRMADGFTEVTCAGDFEVHIVQDSVFYVEVEAENNLLPYIETEVSGSRLELDVKGGRWLDNNYPIRIFISAPAYEKIRLSGSGRIQCDTLDNASIEFDISGSGDITAVSYSDATEVNISGSGDLYLSGYSHDADYRISGSGRIKAFGLETGSSFCHISGSGNMQVAASDLLDVNISGSGSVYYRGYPQVVVTITGSGKVIHD